MSATIHDIENNDRVQTQYAPGVLGRGYGCEGKGSETSRLRKKEVAEAT